MFLEHTSTPKCLCQNPTDQIWAQFQDLISIWNVSGTCSSPDFALLLDFLVSKPSPSFSWKPSRVKRYRSTVFLQEIIGKPLIHWYLHLQLWFGRHLLLKGLVPFASPWCEHISSYTGRNNHIDGPNTFNPYVFKTNYISWWACLVCQMVRNTDSQRL